LVVCHVFRTKRKGGNVYKNHNIRNDNKKLITKK
jgi:hypothetical protein